MLSEEEREAIEKFKNFIYTYQEVIEDKYSDYEEKESAKEYQEVSEKILNLIEKQSKEIEELKAISEYREKIIKGLGLKTLPKTITGFRELIENNDKKWEDKIKAKIEEIDEVLKGQLIEKIRVYFEAQKEVLQSLLEKE